MAQARGLQLFTVGEQGEDIRLLAREPGPARAGA